MFTGIFRIGPAEVDADEPVGPFAGKSGFIQRLVFLVVLDGIEGPFHADVIFGIDEETFNFSVIIVIFQYFVDEQLAFPVRVAGMDDDVGFLEELSQARQEVFLIGGGQELPVFREYLVVAPVLIFRVVFFGHGLAQDMPGSPGYDSIAFCDIVLFPFGTAIRP